MYHISKACYRALFSPSRTMTAKAAIALQDGNVLHLGASDFKSGGIRLSEATSGAGSFDLGAAVISKLALTLNNSDGRFNAVHFIGGQISSVQIGVTLPDSSTEWIPLGIFDIESVKYSGTAAEIVAYDLLSRADRELPAVVCPVTPGYLISTVCTHCGILWSGQRFLNDDYAVEALPEAATCRDIISYAAALAGCYARMSRDGVLTFGWYGDGEDWLDGGIFLDMTSGDDCSGGDFIGYGEAEYDGGQNDSHPVCTIHHPKTFSGDKQITVTGVKFTEPDSQQQALDDEGNEVIETVPGSIHLFGTDEYAFDLSGNPLLTHDVAAVIDALGAKITGTRFCPVTVTCASNPALEAGELISVFDRRGNTFTTCITRCEYKFGAPQSLSCEARTVNDNASVRYSPVSKLEQKIKNDTEAKINAYGGRMQELNNLTLNSMGVYKTAVQNPDGSVTHYTHDKPALAASSYIACETANGFAYTNSGWNNGSPVWRYGMTADGNLICNVLSAVGIVADWIQAGRIESADGSCYFDLDNNQLFANKIGLSKRYLSAGEITTDTGESRAGIACHDDDLSDSAYFQLRPVFSTADGALYGFGLYDAMGRGQITCAAREDNPDNNAVTIFGFDGNGRHTLLAADAAAKGVRIASMNGSNRLIVRDSSVTVNVGNKAALEAGTDYTYIRNAGSNSDYWISLDDNGVSIGRGTTVLQRWS